MDDSASDRCPANTLRRGFRELKTVNQVCTYESEPAGPKRIFGLVSTAPADEPAGIPGGIASTVNSDFVDRHHTRTAHRGTTGSHLPPRSDAQRLASVHPM